MFDHIIHKAFEESTTDVDVSYKGMQAWKTVPDKFSLTAGDIQKLQDKYDFDTASWVLYKYFKEKLTYKKLEVFLDQKRNTFSKDHEDYVVCVLDHNPWATRRQNHTYQWHLKNLAIDAGFSVSYPQVGYRRDLYRNAYYYQTLLKRFSGRKVIFVTHSLASLELRWMFYKYSKLDVQPVGWLNLAGLIYGTSLTTSSGWAPHLKRQFFGEYEVPGNISRSQAYCYGDFQWDEDQLPVISVLPFRPRHTYPWLEDNRQHELDPWGPHDGYISLCDYLKAKHPVWPVWSDSHQLRVGALRTRLQSALMYFVQRDQLNQ